MSNKKISLSIGGHDLTLDFGVNVFYKYFKEGTGTDILAYSKEEIDSIRLVELVSGIVYAGQMANAAVTKTNHTLTKEQVDEFVWLMTPEETNKVLADYNVIMGGVPGEVQGQETKETA